MLSILSLFRKKFNKFNNTGAGMLKYYFHAVEKKVSLSDDSWIEPYY